MSTVVVLSSDGAESLELFDEHPTSAAMVSALVAAAKVRTV
ncbi:hypothetical protein [Mycobacterium sp. NAZ190054]|nr:hypothetical protein [Mycobacterium sp. NAZ190054]